MMQYLVCATYVTYALFVADYVTTLIGLRLVGKQWEANPLWYKVIDIFGIRGFVIGYPALLIGMSVYWNYEVKTPENNAEIGMIMPVYIYTIYNNIKCIRGIYRKSLHIEYSNSVNLS